MCQTSCVYKPFISWCSASTLTLTLFLPLFSQSSLTLEKKDKKEATLLGLNFLRSLTFCLLFDCGFLSLLSPAVEINFSDDVDQVTDMSIAEGYYESFLSIFLYQNSNIWSFELPSLASLIFQTTQAALGIGSF